MEDGARLKIGSVFAQDFRVLRALDEGGMGLVYLVEQLSTRQPRALKVLKPRLLADGKSRDRFDQEATVGARIPSDHVVKVVSAGVDDETGVPWIAMELLEGDTLRERVRARGALPRTEVLELCRQLCHALAAAHTAGVVHRDLKPENIFVAPSRRPGGSFDVKLLDFGIAAVLEEFETSLTPTAVLGSPLWMAPEQVRRGRIKPATDVWALGLIVFYLLTGRYYWRSAAGERSANAEAVLHEKLYEPLEPASKRALALGVTEALPPGFDEWFRRCVARDPGDRYKTASEAFAALEDVLAREVAPLPPRSRWALLGGLLASVLLGGALAYQGAGRPAATARGATASGRERAEADAHDAASAGAAAEAADAAVEAPAASASVTTTVPAPRGAHATTASVATATRGSTAVVTEGVQRAVHATTRGRAPTAAHGTPQSPGYTFRLRAEWNGRCGAGGRAWQVTPVWYQESAAQLEHLEQNLRGEERMAARASPDERGDLEAQIGRDRDALAARRRALSQQVDANERVTGTRAAADARQAGCVDNGLHVESDALYDVWCCP